MNFRLTAILFGLVLVFGLVLLGLTLFSGDNPAGDGLLEELIQARVTPEQIDTVEITKESGESLKLVREKDGWRLAEPVQARADAVTVNRLIGALLKAKPTAYSELSSNPAVHGLAPPSLKVTLSGGGKSSTLNIGNVNPGGEQAVAFVTTSARPDRPMAVRRGDIDLLFRPGTGEGKAGDLARWVSDYRAPTVFPTTPQEDLTAIRLTAGGKVLALSRTEKGGWKLDNPPWGQADTIGDATPNPSTFTGVQGLIAALTSLRANPTADPARPAFIENPPNLATYGLDPAHRIEITLTYKEGETTKAYRAFMGARAPAVPGQPPGLGGDAFVQLEGDSGVMRVRTNSRDAFASIVQDPKPLLDRSLLPPATDVEQVVAVDATVFVPRAKQPPQQLAAVVRRDPPVREGFPHPRPWTLYGGPGDPQTVRPGDRGSPDPVTRALALLAQPRLAKDILPGDTRPHDPYFAPNELKAVISLWSEMEPTDPKAPKGAAPKPKGNPLVFQFGRTRTEKVKQPDGKETDQPTGVYVRRVLPDGSRSDFVLPLTVPGSAPDAGPAVPPKQEDLIALMSLRRSDLLNPNPPPSLRFGPDSVAKVTITTGKTPNLTTTEVSLIQSTAPNTPATWKYTRGKQSGEADVDVVFNDLINPLANLPSTMPANPFVTEEPTPDQLKAWGLDATAARMKVVFTLKAAKQSDPKGPVPPPDQRVFYLGNEVKHGADDCVYVRQEGRAAVFVVRKPTFDKLANADLRNRKIFNFNPADITGIEFQGWGQEGVLQELHFQRDNKDAPWRVTKAPGPYEVDGGKVNQFLRLLSVTRVRSFVPGQPTPEQGFGNPKQYLIITLKTAAGPLIAMNIGAPVSDGSAYYGWTSVLPKEAPVFTLDLLQFKMYKSSAGTFSR